MSDVQLLAELEKQKLELQALISAATEEGDIVGEMNFETRLNAVTEQINTLVSSDYNTAEVAVIFDGGPVKGSRAIDANFAAKGISLFQGIVTRLFASKLSGQLAKRGKLKGAELAALNLRSVVHGSFGFVLEEKEAKQASVFKTPVREAVDEAAELFNEFTQEDEDDFLIDVDDIDPRIFTALSKFFRHLEQHEATLKTNLPDRQLVFDRDGVERAYRRFSETQVRIEPVVWIGTLVGLSPIKRTFDFRRDGTTEIVSGKFSYRVSQDYLERIENEDGIKLGGKFRAKIEIGTIRKSDGTISVSYTVTDLDQQ